jgi:uncharacterized coiled-coil protein SlyX
MHTAAEIIAMTPEEKWQQLEALMTRRYDYPNRGAPTKLSKDIGRHPNTYYKWKSNPESIDPLAIIALERMTVDDSEKVALQRRLISEIADDLAAQAENFGQIASKLSDLSRALRA